MAQNHGQIQMVPQQPMAGPHGQQPGGQPQQQPRLSPGASMQPNQQNSPQFPVTYQGITLRKAQPELGSRPSWSRIKQQPFTVSAKEFASENKTARTQRSVISEYNRLRTDDQREAIDRIINAYRRQEKDPKAVWEIAFIKAHREPIPGTWGRAEETTHIRVILKRSPLQPGQQQPSQFANFGPIIDTTVEESIVMFPQQIPQQKAPQQQQKNPQQNGNQNPGMQPPGMNQPQYPPPPPGMPPPPGGQLPPLPMPPGSMQGPRGNPPQVQQVFNISNSDEKKKSKSNKSKSKRAHSRSISPRTREYRKSMEFPEKIQHWNQDESESDDSESESDSDGSSVDVNGHRNHKSKHHRKNEYKMPRVPMGAYAHGALPPRHGSPPTILKRKVSEKDFRKGNKHVTERKFTEKYRSPDRDSNTSEDSYDFVNEYSGGVRRGYPSPATSVESESVDYSRSRKTRERRHRRDRSLSRDRRYDRSSSRDRRVRLDRRNSIREHRQPDAYRGLSPPAEPREPLIVQIHNHTTNNDRLKNLPQQQAAMRRYSTSPDPLDTMSQLTLDEYNRYPTTAGMPRMLSYPETSPYSNVLPQAPMPPNISRAERDAQAHMDRRRNTFADYDPIERERVIQAQRDHIVRLRREREMSLPSAAPLRADYGRRGSRVYGSRVDDDWIPRTDNEYNRRADRRSSRFAERDYDARDIHVRSTYPLH